MKNKFSTLKALITSCALTLCFLLQPFAVSASFENSLILETYDAPLVQDGEYAEGTQTYQITDYNASSLQSSSFSSKNSSMTSSVSLEEKMYTALINMDESLNISYYQVTLADAFETFGNIINSRPELFYVKGQIQGNYYSSTGYAANLYFTYNYTADEVKVMNTTFNNEVNTILASIDSDGMTDIEKALAIHEYFAMHCCYDYTYTIFDAYNMIVNKTGVCQSYALAYLYIANKLGINCAMITSDEINHAWNIVEVDGYYYYVDVTWDDNYKTIGKSAHYNFMKSEEAIVSLGHTGMNQTYESDGDTTYDNYFWTNVTNGITYLNGLWYYIGYNNTQDYYYLASYNFATGEQTEIYRPNIYLYYNVLYSNVVAHGDKLYFNGSNCIYSVNPDGTDQQVVFNVDSSSTDKIFGMQEYNGNLQYTLKDIPTNSDVIYTLSFDELAPLQEETTTETTVPETTTTEPETTIKTTTTLETTTITETTTIPETTIVTETTTTSQEENIDFNGDGKISISDVVAFSKYIVSNGDISENSNADLNGDGRINSLDVATMKAILLNIAS